MSGLAAAVNFVLTPQSGDEDTEERKKRCLQAVTDLSKAFALAVPDEEALAMRDEVGFFQAVRPGWSS